MTSEPIAAYGGITIPSETLNNLAEQMTVGRLPFHLEHDLSKPLRIRGTRAFVVTRADGIDELRFEAEMHEDDLPLLELNRGMSVTMRVPLERDGAAEERSNATLEVSADHAWFEDDALFETEKSLLALGIAPETLRVERTYQFGLVPAPQIFLDVIYPLVVSLGAAAMWDGIKVLFRRRRTPSGGSAETPSVINISVFDGDRSLQAVVTTRDEAIAQQAFESIGPIMEEFFRSAPASQTSGEERQPVVTWDAEALRWTAPN